MLTRFCREEPVGCDIPSSGSNLEWTADVRRKLIAATRNQIHLEPHRPVPEYRQLYVEARHTLIEKAYPLQPYIYEEGERENPWTYFLPKTEGE